MPAEPGVWGERDSLRAFRIHRHDVLNGLQLVRGYIQLNRPAQAMAAVDRMTAWLQSLSLWHVHEEECGPQLVWTAACCPYVYLAEMADPPRWTDALRSATAEVWNWLNAAAARHGFGGVGVRLRASHDLVELELIHGEGFEAWWNTVTDWPAAVRDGRVRLSARSRL